MGSDHFIFDCGRMTGITVVKWVRYVMKFRGEQYVVGLNEFKTEQTFRRPEDGFWYITNVDREGYLLVCALDDANYKVEKASPRTCEQVRTSKVVVKEQLNVFEGVKWLLKNGAAADSCNNQAIVHMSKIGHINAIRVLFEHGADPRARDNAPLHLACHYNYLDAATLLLEYGADPIGIKACYQNGCHETGRILLTETVMSHFERNKVAHACFLMACEEGDFEAVKYLIDEHHTKPDFREKHWYKNALYLACDNAYRNDKYKACVEYILNDIQCDFSNEEFQKIKETAKRYIGDGEANNEYDDYHECF